MKKLCVFSLYSEKGASSQYRAYIFKNEFEKSFDVKWYYFWNDNYASKYLHNKKKYFIQIVFLYLVSMIKRIFQLVFIAPKCDVVFVQKAIIPKFKYTFLKKLKKQGVRIIFDVDDAVYTNKKDNSDIIAGFSDVVICGNQNLKDHYLKFNKNSIIIPTVDRTFMYEPFWKDTFDSKIIGWIGSKTTINNFDLVIDALNKLTDKHPEVKIAIISNTILDYGDKIKNSYLVPWDKETYIDEIGKFTIGIMPLKDTEFNRGKCGFKLIQYLNMKKPVVGSGIGVNSDIIKGNGFIAGDSDEWFDSLESILFDRQIYDNYIKHIENEFFSEYHFDIVSKKILSIFNE